MHMNDLRNKSLIRKISNLVKGGFLHIFLGTFANKAIAMLSSVFVARIVDKTDYAYLNYSETLYGYLILFLGLGMSSALLKVCSGKAYTRKDGAYLRFALKFGVLYEIIITIVFIGCVLLIYIPFQGAKFYILATILYPIILYIYDLLLCYLRSKQENKVFAYLSFAYSVITCIATIGIVYAVSAIGVIIARYIAIISIVSFLIYFLSKKFIEIEYSTLSKEDIKSFLKMAISLMVANALSGMMPINENFLVSNLLSDEVITSNFKVASLFPQLLLLVTQSVMIYYFPLVAEMDNKGENTRRFVTKITLLNTILIVLAMIIGIVLTPWLITSFYGEKYSDSIDISYILWLVNAINAVIRMVPINMLVAIKRYKYNLYMAFYSVIIQFVLDWLFIKQFGVIGVLYGTTIVYLVTGLIYWYLFYKSTKQLSYE